jgi:hypothetical protein
LDVVEGNGGRWLHGAPVFLGCLCRRHHGKRSTSCVKINPPPPSPPHRPPLAALPPKEKSPNPPPLPRFSSFSMCYPSLHPRSNRCESARGSSRVVGCVPPFLLPIPPHAFSLEQNGTKWARRYSTVANAVQRYSTTAVHEITVHKALQRSLQASLWKLFFMVQTASDKRNTIH